MSVWQLVLREIRHRRLSFALGVLAVAVAVASVVGQVGLLTQDDMRTDKILLDKQAETQARMDKLNDEIRIITKNLGFNIRILPKDLNLADFYARDFADKYMPEEYARRLSESKIVSINHLLPSLEQKVDWPELDLPIVLIGTGGEVPMAALAKKKPILEAVPRGKVVVGYQLRKQWAKLTGKEIHVGDPLTFKGKFFQVFRLHESRGDRDDITLWINLKDAQEMLGKKGLINGMLALECNCSAGRLAMIRQDIAEVLPDTQVEEFETKATARAEARNQVEAEGRAALERERNHRIILRQEKEAFAAIMLPLVILGAGLLVGILAWMNILEREAEMGLYRALGCRSWQCFMLFLSRALMVGLIGAVVGMGAGLASGLWLADDVASWTGFVLDPWLWMGCILLAPLVSALASWLPALMAARRDPAAILQKE